MRTFRFIAALLFAAPLLAGQRYIVEFHDGPTLAQAQIGIDRAVVRREYSRVLHGVAIELREGESIASIARLPQVARVTPDWIVEAFDDGESVARTRRVTTNSGGAGVVVAVIDTGIDYNHPALGGGFGAGRKVRGGFDFVNNDADPMDDHRHGTHVAGIIAARSAAVTGLAPDVALLAYKVLGADGKGRTSDIIAGIERAVAEGADILNISLGGPGHPGDPLSRAVDNAVAQGVIVCVAAGNEGEGARFHTIGSPAAAALAITVGAANGAQIAEFSSRGPAHQNGAIKPDVVAPGVGIVSTVPGGGVLALSGTSMATPYVSALAALLLEEHPQWTPERIKAAIASTAIPLATLEEVMTQGSGAVNVARAQANALVPSTTQLNFGLDGATSPHFEATRTFTLRNDSATERVVKVSATSQFVAAQIHVTPSEATIAAGQSATFEATVALDHATESRGGVDSFAFGGLVSVDSGNETLARLPWAFVRAARATISYDDAFPTVLWKRLADGYEAYAPISPNAIELLLKPGRYDFAVIGENEGNLRLFILEDRALDGDIPIALTAADAPNEIRFDAQMPVAIDGENTLYFVRARLLFPDDEGSIVMPDIPARTMHTSSFSNRYGILATESFVDVDTSAIVIAQHPTLRSVSGDVTLHVDTHDYRPQQLEMYFADGATMRELVVMPRDWPRDPLQFGPRPPSLQLSVPASVWKGVLYMTPEVHADYAAGVQLSTLEDEEDLGFSAVNSPMIRRDADGFFAVRGFVKPALPIFTVAGEPLVFGNGVLRPPAIRGASPQYWGGDANFIGDRDDIRRGRKLDATWRVVDAGGTEVAEGEVDLAPLFVPLHAGRYRAEIRTHKVESGLMTMNFDTTNGTITTPAFTWLSIHDAVGRRATRLPYNGNASLVFAAANAITSRTSIFFRRSGSTTWVQLTPVETGVDAEAGTIYRVDLADALRVRGDIDIAIGIGDVDGNTTEWTLERAFTSFEEPTRTKRRAVR